MSHNTSWSPLLLALGAILIAVEVVATAAVVLSLSGNSPLPVSGAPAAPQGGSVSPAVSYKLTSLTIEPHSVAESVTGGDFIASPDPTSAPAPEPTPAPDPTSEPATAVPNPVPAAVYVAPTPPPPPPPPAPTPIPGSYRSDLSDELYGLLNGVRTANGLGTVSPNDALIGSAVFYAQYLFVVGNPYTLDHWLVGGPGQRAWARGYCCGVGEILVESEGDAQGMVDLWMQSVPHRDIILDPQYKAIGVSCYGGPFVGADGNVHNPIVCAAEFGSG